MPRPKPDFEEMCNLNPMTTVPTKHSMYSSSKWNILPRTYRVVEELRE